MFPPLGIPSIYVAQPFAALKVKTTREAQQLSQVYATLSSQVIRALERRPELRSRKALLETARLDAEA